MKISYTFFEKLFITVAMFAMLMFGLNQGAQFFDYFMSNYSEPETPKPAYCDIYITENVAFMNRVKIDYPN